jgi:alanine racemase
VRRYRPTVVEVDLEAIRHNVRALKPAGAELMAVVKGSGYGHGDVAVARAAMEAGATWLGVALVEEGIALRDAGITAPVLVLSEFPPGSERDAVSAGLTPTVYSEEGIDAVAAAARGRDRRIAVHIKADTGMHRVGAWPPSAIVQLAAQAVDSGLVVEGVWTHFARAEDDPPATREQLERLADVVRRLPARPRYLHAANSAATILHPRSHLDLVRPGIACYGLEPAPGVGASLGLRPALAWRSRVAMVRRLPAGEALSYGHSYRLERDATIATVPVGYEDGYARSLSSRADVLIAGRRRRVAGSVTMDQILVDCGDDPVQRGDEVVLLGRDGDEDIPAPELARLMGTISYELVTAIGERVPRVYLNQTTTSGERARAGAVSAFEGGRPGAPPVT